MLYIIVTANILIGLSFFFRLTTLPPQIPLFYSRPWGEFQITDWWFIFLLPILMNVLYFANLYILKKFFRDEEDNFVRSIIGYLNLFLIISFTLIFLKIIFLIT
jgi:hypothetical protein